MTCANLLAFIQIAVVFDFGLLYLNDTHILTQMFSSFRKEMRQRVGGCMDECDEISRKLKKRAANIKFNICAEKIRASRNKLDALVDPTGNIPWGKYAALGLYAGTYGLLCLIIVGALGGGGGTDCFKQDFLIVSAQVIFIMEIITLCQMHSMEKSNPSIVKMLKKTKDLIVILVVVGIIAFFDCTIHLFPDFETPFFWSTILIVYFPFIVILARVWWAYRQIHNVVKECEENNKNGRNLLDS